MLANKKKNLRDFCGIKKPQSKMKTSNLKKCKHHCGKIIWLRGIIWKREHAESLCSLQKLSKYTDATQRAEWRAGDHGG